MPDDLRELAAQIRARRDQGESPLQWLGRSRAAVDRMNQPPERREPTMRASTPMERVNDALVSLYEWLGRGIGQVPGASALGFDPAGMAQQMRSPGGQTYAAPLPITGKPPRIANPIKAHHGSPHDFDQFSLDKIGTGEGAQAYGHGLYFAESPDVAKAYKDKLVPAQNVVGDELRALYEKHGKNWAAAVDDFMRHVYDTPKAKAQMRETFLAQGPPVGRMYEVAIHANPDDFLDWDKPLSQQSEKVRAAIDKLVKTGDKAGADKLFAELTEGMDAGAIDEAIASAKTDFSGKQAYEQITDLADRARRGSMPYAKRVETASETLRKSGVPGIKYLDAGSRAAGDGSRNYVVFDEQLIEILRKYGLLPPAVLGAQALRDGDGR